MARRCMALWAGTLLLSLPAMAEPFSYLPPGELSPGGGTGNADLTVHSPNMRFPIEEAPAFANSQVYGRGGVFGPGGRECDLPNFSYPWRDTFCEKRANAQTAQACPTKTQVHQGNDIRAKTCKRNTQWAVAVEDGVVVKIGSFSLYLVGAETGIKYTYLHMDPGSLQVGEHNTVTKGQRLGRVSNNFGDQCEDNVNHPCTTTHLHFEIQLPTSNGFSFVSPYMSLVMAYQRLLGETGGDGTPTGTSVTSDAAPPTGSTTTADTTTPPAPPPAPPPPNPQPRPPREPAPVFSTNPDVRME